MSPTCQTFETIQADLYVEPSPFIAQCRIRIHIKRDFFLDIVKNLGPLVIVGYVLVLTLWLNPTVPPVSLLPCVCVWMCV